MESRVRFKVQHLTDEEIERRLLALEKRHGIESEAFLLKFNTGQLDDDPDFIDWAGLLTVAGRVGLLHRMSA